MAETIQTKRCSKCKQVKSVLQFSKHHNRKDGLQNYCKICLNATKKRYRQTKKGKATEKRYENSEKYKAYKKRYRQTEKGKATYRKAWCRYKQTDKYIAKCKRYKQTDKYKAKRKRYSVRYPERRKAKDAVHTSVRYGKLPRPDTLQCHYCPARAEQYHHHLGYEPKHWLDVIPVCFYCHTKLHKKSA